MAVSVLSKRFGEFNINWRAPSIPSLSINPGPGAERNKHLHDAMRNSAATQQKSEETGRVMGNLRRLKIFSLTQDGTRNPLNPNQSALGLSWPWLGKPVSLHEEARQCSGGKFL
ncbi:hypothetical protein PZ897_18290 [Hoeflea sp. YIM 152468]|uniref:hypothetical protein n=1 Tax=Hoeflea sp. YIM 152468 TaxID=3031759 RepID=UPI0023DB6B43|nr:hypothetical protein [Hoeflea sp. YIM 152468]MDF1610136.1 hypothetical protein [Hoeflea sp. YIM 152468]